MSITTYMLYNIYLSNQSEYDILLAASGGSSFIQMAPRDAATMLGIPYPYPSGDLDTIGKTIAFMAPFVPGSEFFYPGSTGTLIDDTVDFQDITAQAGNPASIWPADSPAKDGHFVWAGIVQLINSSVADPTLPNMPQRRWIDGFDLDNTYSLTSLLGGGHVLTSRDAARFPGGFGMPIRGNTGTGLVGRHPDDYRTGLVTKTSWERFYVRVRTLPGTVGSTPMFWSATSPGNVMAGIGIKSDGTQNFWITEKTSGNPTTLFAQLIAPFELMQWYRFDLFFRFDNVVPPNQGKMEVYIDGALAVSYAGTAAQGLRVGTQHFATFIGQQGSTLDQFWEVDIDDWSNMDLPANMDANTLQWSGDPSIDVLMGSHMRLHFMDPATIASSNWTGFAGVPNQLVNPDGNAATSNLVSTTSQALISGQTDVPLMSVQDILATVLGPLSAINTERSLNAAATDGALGYKLAGAATVFTTINQTAAVATLQQPYLPTGLPLPIDIAPYSVVHRKSADANSDTTTSVGCYVEYIGVFGPCDDASAAELDTLWLHNHRYEKSPYAYYLPNIAAPVYCVGGTYTGNGTYQEVTLPDLCHMLFIRPTGGAGNNGMWFFGASEWGHLGCQDKLLPNFRVWFDEVAQACKFSVNGTNADVNQSAVVYQYIALCDPGARFCLAGAYLHPLAGSSTYSNSYIDPNFTAEFQFYQYDNPQNTSNDGVFAKGPGMSGTTGRNLRTGASQPSLGTLTAGGFTTGTPVLSQSGGQINYLGLRTTEEGCAGVMLQTMTYTGNGSNPRTITLTPTSGRMPLWVLVIPTGATPMFRDPSHIGTNSSQITTVSANTANGITGVGVDSITVNSVLNVNTTVYTVLALCGAVGGMTNGEYYNGMCEPPDGGADGRPVPVEVSNEPNIIATGGLVLNGAPGMLLMKDIGGIYTLIVNKREDTLIDRATGQPSVDVQIPDPHFKTGYVGG